jgi:hypothetical protein
MQVGKYAVAVVVPIRSSIDVWFTVIVCIDDCVYACLFALRMEEDTGGKEEGMRGEKKEVMGKGDRSYVLTASDALSDRKQIVAESGGRGKDAGAQRRYVP